MLKFGQMFWMLGSGFKVTNSCIIVVAFNVLYAKKYWIYLKQLIILRRQMILPYFHIDKNVTFFQNAKPN